jgi:hypothetical protein
MRQNQGTGKHVGGMGGRKGERPGAINQEVNVLQNVTRPDPSHQRFDQGITNLVAESDPHDQKRDGNSSPSLSEYGKGNYHQSQRYPPVIQIGQDGHQKIKKTILDSNV